MGKHPCPPLHPHLRTGYNKPVLFDCKRQELQLQQTEMPPKPEFQGPASALKYCKLEATMITSIDRQYSSTPKSSCFQPLAFQTCLQGGRPIFFQCLMEQLRNIHLNRNMYTRSLINHDKLYSYLNVRHLVGRDLEVLQHK